MAVVYTGGTFDLPHLGHIRFLKNCKKISGLDGKVVVALNKDDFIYKFKNRKPVMSFQERKEVLENLRFVDEVIVNESGADSKPTILKVKPDFVVIGSDWAVKDYYAQMQFTQKWLDKHEITLCYVPYTEGISTTVVKERVKSQ